MTTQHTASIPQRISLAQEILITVFTETKSTEIGDVLDMLIEYRDQYNQDNSRSGVGA